MDVKLSFVIPCYNVSKFVIQCLDSIYSQNVSIDEFEVICIDDCSTDNTCEIIEEYRSNYPNLYLIKHRINQKQGGARNTGLDIAKGKYIWFVDPDDYIVSDCLKEIINYCTSSDYEMFFFDYCQFGLSDEENKISSNFKFSSIKNGVDIFEFDDFWKLTSICWSRIVKKDFLISNKIRFYNSFVYEDVIYGVVSFQKARKISYINKVLYYYRQNPTSVMKGKINGMKLASILKLACEFSKLAKESVDNQLAIRFYQMSVSYEKPIFKRLLKLSTIERRVFYEHIALIENLKNYLRKEKNKMYYFLLVRDIVRFRWLF